MRLLRNSSRALVVTTGRREYKGSIELIESCEDLSDDSADSMAADLKRRTWRWRRGRGRMLYHINRRKKGEGLGFEVKPKWKLVFKDHMCKLVGQ